MGALHVQITETKVSSLRGWDNVIHICTKMILLTFVFYFNIYKLRGGKGRLKSFLTVYGTHFTNTSPVAAPRWTFYSSTVLHGATAGLRAGWGGILGQVSEALPDSLTSVVALSVIYQDRVAFPAISYPHSGQRPSSLLKAPHVSGHQSLETEKHRKK